MARMDAAPVAIVTGAGGGIGAAIAAGLAGEGFSLVLADRSRELLDATATSLSAPGKGGSGKVVTSIGDVGDPSHHAGLVTAAEDMGWLAVSVQNAGVFLPGLSWEIPIEQWELQIQANYWGVVHGVRAALGVMTRRGSGHVVAMSSGAGLVATPGMAPYVSSKHAVVGMMESIRHELARVAPGVRASVVCPGNVATPMSVNSLAAAGVVNEDLSPEARRVADRVRSDVAAGADPTTVADAVLDAIRTGRFWVLPQPEVALGALDRVQRIVDGGEPVDLLG